jgi:hypothetical protein
VCEPKLRRRRRRSKGRGHHGGSQGHSGQQGNRPAYMDDDVEMADGEGDE